MGTTWTYQKQGIEVGPISSTELKALAEAGGLGPGDLVKREGMLSYVPAARVKGLFPSGAGGRATSVQPSLPATAITPQAKSEPTGIPPSPPEPIATFVEWYKANLGYQWLFAQGVLWVCYGFIWIPLWWLITRSTLTKSQALALAAQPRTPGLSYAIGGFCALAFAWGMIRPIVDPAGYAAARAEQARVAAEKARVVEQKRAAEQARTAQARVSPPQAVTPPRGANNFSSDNHQDFKKQMLERTAGANSVSVTLDEATAISQIAKAKAVPFSVFLKAVKIGMSSDQIIATIGRPDYVERSKAIMGGATWDYRTLILHDITHKPTSIELYFDTAGRLNTIIYDGRFWDQGSPGVSAVPGGYKSSDSVKQVTQGMQELLQQIK